MPLLARVNSAERPNLSAPGNSNREAMAYIRPEIAHNAAIFPDARTPQRSQLMHDLDRAGHRVPNRIWLEIKLR